MTDDLDSTDSSRDLGLLERFVGLPTSAVVDAVIRLNVVPPERMTLRGLKPMLGPLSRAAGFARTQQLVARRHREQTTVVSDRARHFELVDDAQPNDFLVIAVASQLPTATFGDILALKAAARGAAGVVLDGYTRDLGYIVELGLPMWCKGTALIPAGYSSLSVESTGDAVTCCGVEVMSGDIVVADGDGVVVVERSSASQIADCCEEMEAAEQEARRGARAGRRLRDLYPSREYYQES